jgi:uncharacterized protein (DUF1501 family)
MTEFPAADFAALPTVSFVVPNLANDMHDGSVGAADNWLKTNIGSYATWAMSHNSLLIVTWDEDARPGSALDAAWPLDADWGLHPALADSLQALFERRKLAFVPFAGTDDTSRSHFETQDSFEPG